MVEHQAKEQTGIVLEGGVLKINQFYNLEAGSEPTEMQLYEDSCLEAPRSLFDELLGKHFSNDAEL